MKFPWPVAFADGDVEEWITDFERIAACNGVKGDTPLLAALGALLTGRAKAVYDLKMGGKTSPTYREVRAGLVKEFTQEGDRQKAMDRFNTARYDSTQDPVVHYQYLLRQLSIGLPEASGVTRARLVRDRFVQSMAPDVQGRLRMAIACGVNDTERLFMIVRAAQE